VALWSTPVRTDSCSGRCGYGTDSGFSCQCNPSCERHSDCCSDYAELCKGNNGSALLRTGPFMSSNKQIILGFVFVFFPLQMPCSPVRADAMRATTPRISATVIPSVASMATAAATTPASVGVRRTPGAQYTCCVVLPVKVWRMPYLAIPKRRLCTPGHGGVCEGTHSHDLEELT